MPKTKKTIAINTRFLLPNKLEGIGHFTCESLRRITQQHPEHDFIFLFDRPYSAHYIFANNIRPVVVSPQARHPILWYLWFEWAIPRHLSTIRPDIFVSTDGYGSLRSNTPSLVVLHDLAFEHYPEQVPFMVRKYYQYYSPKFAQKASRIATVSEYTKQDICDKYGISPSKIDVVHNGANDIYAPLSSDEKQQIKAQYTQGSDYFLFVGAIHPRKNLANILRAYEQLKQQGNCSAKFVVAGRKAWQSSEAFTVYEQMQFKSEVIFLGHLQLSVLAKIYAAATALVYASLFEGFGIPIIEAMRSEVPVITANTSSMPEVAGDAALLVSPDSVAQISTAMQQLYEQPALRQQLIGKGKVQYQKFGWQQTADKLWASIERVLYL